MTSPDTTDINNLNLNDLLCLIIQLWEGYLDDTLNSTDHRYINIALKSYRKRGFIYDPETDYFSSALIVSGGGTQPNSTAYFNIDNELVLAATYLTSIKPRSSRRLNRRKFIEANNQSVDDVI
jgi:hypothetical protein